MSAATAEVTSSQNLSRLGIGASEIAAIAGMNPFSSPWDIWLRKTGQAPDVEQNQAMEWGHRLEPAIRQKYSDDMGAVIHVPPASLFSPERTWARATPDGIVMNADPAAIGDRRMHLLQCKNVGYWVEKAWSAAPPAYVQLQEQWEMYVTGLLRADVAVLIGGNDFRIYSVHRDDKVIGDLLAIADDFWKKVETRVAPPVDDSDACRDHFEKKLTREKVEVLADASTEALFAEWHALTLEAKQNKKRVETIRNLMRKQLAEAQASTIRSSEHGAASLVIYEAPKPYKTTDWEQVATLIASAKCTAEEFAELVNAATTTHTPSAKAPTLYAPREWGKETL